MGYGLGHVFPRRTTYADVVEITGERTVPGIAHENYWFRRHEVCYRLLCASVPGLDVLEAGCGEGYGAALLTAAGARVVALDYDACATAHVRATYPELPVLRGNLVDLPFADASFDLVASLQTIEHLWDQPGFVAECVRVLRPGGRLVLTTPNRRTFPPGNIFHTHELDARELHDLVAERARVVELAGLSHGDRLSRWELAHGDLVQAQLAGPPESWSSDLTELVDSVRTADFDLRSGAVGEPPLEGCLDLWLVAVRP